MDMEKFLAGNSEELSRKYPGKYLAVIDEKIVAVGSNPLEAFTKAKEIIQGKEMAIFYMPTDEEMVILL